MLFQVCRLVGVLKAFDQPDLAAVLQAGLQGEGVIGLPVGGAGHVSLDEELVELCSRLREVGRGSCAILFCEDEVLVESRPGRRLATSSGDVAR